MPIQKALLLNYSYQGGGAARTAHELLPALAAAGVEAALWIGTAEVGMPGNVRCISGPGEQFYRPMRRVFPAWQWLYQAQNKRLANLRRGDFEVVHFHTISQHWVSMQSLYKLCRRMPAVWTQHDEWALSLGLECDMRELFPPAQLRALRFGRERLSLWSRYHDHWRYRLRRKMLERWLPQPQVVICPAEHLTRRLLATGRFPKAKVVTIIHGLPFLDHPDTLLPQTEARRRLGISPEVRAVALVAGEVTAPHKGLAYALEALRQIPPASRPCLLLAGTGAAEIAHQNPDVHIVPVAAADDTALACLYRAADLTLVPSLVESLSYVALESLACRRPVVVFRIGGPAEIVGDDERGLVAEAFDTRQYARHIESLLADAARRENLGEMGRKWVEVHCAMAGQTAKTLACYEEAVESFQTNPSREH